MFTDRGLDRIALAAAVVTFFLLTVGGLVTSLDAGMVFLDWPLSNGSLMPDGWVERDDMLTEHGHRLLGGLLGALTLVLAIGLQRTERRRFVRVLGWSALGAVSVQGLLGGLRVTEVSTELAMVHGVCGQLVFCLVVALAYLRSADARRAPEAGASTRALTRCTVALFVTLLAQITLGARLRHVGGPVFNHVLGAVLTFVGVSWVLTFVLLRHRRRRALFRPAMVLAALLLVQAALGIASQIVLVDARPHHATALQVLVPSTHQVVGALMIATTTLLAARAWRRLRAPAGAVVGASGRAAA